MEAALRGLMASLFFTSSARFIISIIWRKSAEGFTLLKMSSDERKELAGILDPFEATALREYGNEDLAAEWLDVSLEELEKRAAAIGPGGGWDRNAEFFGIATMPAHSPGSSPFLSASSSSSSEAVVVPCSAYHEMRCLGGYYSLVFLVQPLAPRYFG